MKVVLTDVEREGIKNTMAGLGRKKTEEEMFYDLCFCIMAPQTKFVNNMKVIAGLKGMDFFTWNYSTKIMREVVKPVRFYRNKTRYLLEAKRNWKQIYHVLTCDVEPTIKRTWLVNHVNGLGMKASSHLLRNLGDQTLSIIDTHILKFMNIDLPKNNSHYLKLEKKFCKIASENSMTPAELDALVWQRYSKTPWENFKY